jgi:hypothetical protein
MKAEKVASKRPMMERLRIISIWILCIVTFLAVSGYFLLNTLISRPHLNFPLKTLYRLRIDLIVDGKAVSFQDDEYQSKELTCANASSVLPMSFQEKKGHILTVHWQGITGGEVLKYYGLNKIGGLDNVLGYRLDTLPNIQAVNTKQTTIPKPSSNSNIYVYTGRANDIKAANSIDFLTQDLEVFLKKSKHRLDKQGLVQKYNQSIAVTAQTSVPKTTTTTLSPIITDAQLNEINDSIGNIVVFFQEKEPDYETVKSRFDALTPLSASGCN